ncbi:putative salicylate hydroxylase [Roridomyces roridus]|uniref:Salicylate hydroxylase n=1 Tax=Roridomyces roridus TaxID=1738132 RepID=A0AAD7BZD1_9AGAR|nr:putative salicylate hydroxylase [Roridomyces roridus]
MSSSNLNVAIIGSGLAGLCLALALHQQGISCTVYESRASPLNIGGAVMLSPNALRVLDALGVYSTVKQQGHNFDTLHFRDTAGTLLEEYEFGSKDKYGYQGLRIFRTVLIDSLMSALNKTGVPLHFGRKFSHVVNESADGVTFQFADGTTETASILVGADGIHSTVRKYLHPDLVPAFTGMTGITAAVPTAQLQLPEGYHIPVTIVHPTHSAFVIAPQQPDGSQVLIGRQRRLEGPEPSREAWDALIADKASSISFLRAVASDASFPQFVRNAVSEINPETINVWPFYIVPRLDKWASERHHRVLILGDAAHAIPPSAGQGINQAFEDSYMLALLVGCAGKVNVGDALQFWQTYRQERVDRVLALNKQIDLRRIPGAGAGREPFNLGWLYEQDFKKDVEEWVASRVD